MTDDRPSAPRNVHDISGPGDRYEALAEFLEQHASQSAEDRARELEAERRRREARNSTAIYWLAGVLFIITAWLWLLPPSFLRMDPPPPPPVVEEEAGLRFAIYLQAQRLKLHREETGEYPERLEEAGPPLPGMRYMRLAPGLYQLTGETDRMALTYRSDLPLDEFVRSGAEVFDDGAP